MKRNERREVQPVEPWIVDRVSDVLKATGRLSEYSIEDIAEDDLRQIVGNIQHAKRMREPDFSIVREGGDSSPSSALIWDEVMK